MSADLDQTPFAEVFWVATCPNCGLAHASTSKFCRACGHALTNLAPPLSSTAAPRVSAGPGGSFPLAASAAPIAQPEPTPQAKIVSEAHALVIALSVVIGLPIALLSLWGGAGAALLIVWNDRLLLNGAAALAGLAAMLALLIWFGRASWRWLLAGILCWPLALLVYIYKERRGAISRRTGRRLARFPGLAINASLIGAGILAIIGAAVFAGTHGRGASTHDVVEARSAPNGVLGRYALSCACAETGTQHFDVIVNGAGLSGRVGSARAAGEFVVITLKITNTGDSPAVFPSRGGYALVDDSGHRFDAIRLTDRAGRTFTQDYAATEEFWYMTPSARWPTDQLQPGIAYTIGLVFDVPAGDPGLVVNIGATTTLPLPDLKSVNVNNDAL